MYGRVCRYIIIIIIISIGLFYFITFVTIKSSFIQLMFNGLLMIALLPVIAVGMGINIRSYVSEILKKYR